MARILIVDDRPVNRQFLVTLLGYNGHTLLEANDGAEGLEIVRSQRPELVITDILMPTMDGYEFVRQIRIDPSIAETKVLFYTAHYHETEAKALALGCGVSTVLTKPCEPDTILSTVESALGNLPAAAAPPRMEDFDREHLALLTDKLSSKAEELRRTNERLTALVELGLKLGSERDPLRLLQVFSEAAREIIGARYVVVAIPNGIHPPYKYFVTSGMDSAMIARVGRPEPPSGVLGSILSAGRSFRAANPVGLEPAGIPASFPPCRAILASAVHSPSRVHGWVCLIDKLGADAFSEEDERLIRMLSAQVGRIYENGSLYGDLLKHATRLAEEVTERNRTEEALRESEGLFRGAFEHTGVAMVLTDIDNRFLRVNNAFANLFGFAPEKMLGMTMAQVTHPDQLAESYAGREDLLAGKRPFFQLEKKYYHRDGHLFWAMTSVSLVRDSTGRPLLYVGQVQDITERKRAEENLRLFRALIDRTTDGVEVIDPATGQFIDVNERACLTHGYTREEYLKLSVREIDPVVGAQIWEEVVASHRPEAFRTFESYHRRKDNSTFPVEVNLNFITLDREYMVAVVRDISERLQLKEQFYQSQKMEAVGRLAGGVAHDFNNLLTVINGYSELVLESLPPSDATHALIQEIRDAGERATALTRQLLAFSRKAVVEPKDLDLRQVVGEVEKMLRRIVGEDVNLVVAAGGEIGSVKADPSQIEQVLLNLVVNARDAMPTGGQLQIRLENQDSPLEPAIPEGRYVLLSVADTGCGMDAATIARAFEPFFTTKGERGTGLGLATVYGIVHQAGGYVTISSEVGRGTTFQVYFPRNDRPSGERKSIRARADMSKGTGTILLVEDENAVRALARHVLQGSGYQVVEARDGMEAVQIAEDHAGKFDLLVTDVVMPRMGGREAAKRIMEINPSISVLYLSGYTDDAVVRHGIRESEVAFLQKPFTTTVLINKVREMLQASPGPSAGN